MVEDKVQTDEFCFPNFRSENFQLRQTVVDSDGSQGSLKCEDSQTMNGGWEVFKDGADVEKVT